MVDCAQVWDCMGISEHQQFLLWFWAENPQSTYFQDHQAVNSAVTLSYACQEPFPLSTSWELWSLSKDLPTYSHKVFLILWEVACFFTARFSPFHRKLMLTGSADGADGRSICIFTEVREWLSKCLSAGIEWEFYWTWRKRTVNVRNFSCKHQGHAYSAQRCSCTKDRFAICQALWNFSMFCSSGPYKHFFHLPSTAPSEVFMCHTEQFSEVVVYLLEEIYAKTWGFLSRTRYIIWASCFVTRRGTFRHAQFPQLRGPPQGLPVLLHDMFFHEIFLFVTQRDALPGTCFKL